MDFTLSLMITIQLNLTLLDFLQPKTEEAKPTDPFDALSQPQEKTATTATEEKEADPFDSISQVRLGELYRMIHQVVLKVLLT